MTVSTATSRSGPYAGAGTTGPFTVNFRFLDASHLEVIRTDATGEHVLVLSTDYTVAGVGNPTGSVTLLAALPAGQTLTIIRDVPVTQEADYVQNDDFPAQSHENAIDKLTMVAQQLGEAQGRALTLAASSPSGVSTVLPAPSSNKLIGWNQSATGLQNIDAATLVTIAAFGTARADVFSGTGAQTAFTLTASPGAQANLDVAIGGVTQRPGIDYTWASGTTLTFTTAPPLGTNNVLARYMQALPQGVSDSAASQFIQTGTGAVQRTGQDKMRDTTNVRDYGAVVNGAGDDTSAITKAITARANFALGGGTSKTLSTITTQTGTAIAGATQPKYLGPVATADTILTNALTGITIGGPGNSIRGMHLKPVTPNQVGGIGINGLDKYFLEMGDALVENFETGIRQEKSLYHTYRRVDVQGGKYGMRFIAAVGAWNIDWFNNVITMENCRLRQNSECNLDFQGQGLKAINCDFSGGITTGAKASVRVRAGTLDANFDACYMEALGVGAFPYLIEGGTTRITGGFVQGGAPATRCQALVRATGGAKVIVDGLTAQDYFNNLFEADGAGSVIYIMPGTKLGASYLAFKSETAGGKVIDLSTFDPADKMDQSLFINDVVAIANGGTYTYQLTSSESINVRAYLVLNGGFNLFSVTGTAVWVNLGAGTGANLHNLVSSSGSVTVAIANATGIMTITNSSGFAGTMRFKAQIR